MSVSLDSEKMGPDISQHDEAYAFSDSAEREIAEYFESNSDKESHDF